MATLPSGLPDQLEPDEDLARFLTQGNHYSRIVAKPAAFLPNPKDRETSVSRHSSEPVERLWKLGQAAAGERPLYGAAILKARSALSAGLQVVADEPPDRHAVLRGWPWLQDADLQRAEQKKIAMILASAAGEPLLRPED